jgi:hypothetical protein
MAVNPVIQISKPKEAQGRTRFLSDEERERLLVVCRSSQSIHHPTPEHMTLPGLMTFRETVLGISITYNPSVL